MRRIQTVRMEEARGLLLFSTLNVTQVAEYLGYPRLHEFSREFSQYFGAPPSRVRSD
jgi:AraC-like DNA-binding protein